MLNATRAALPAQGAARGLSQLAPPIAAAVPVQAARAFLAHQVRLLPGNP